MSKCFTWFPIGVLGEPYMYHDLDDFTRMWEGFRREHQICGTLYFLRI